MAEHESAQPVPAPAAPVVGGFMACDGWTMAGGERRLRTRAGMPDTG